MVGCVRSQELVHKAIREQLLPFARRNYSHLNAAFDKQPYPRPGNLFIVRYSAASGRPGGRGLKLHKDETALTFNMCLSPQDGFEGGGTYFPASSSDVDGILIRPCPGHCLVHDGNIKHAGNDVITGDRYILVGFYNADGRDRAGEDAFFNKKALEETKQRLLRTVPPVVQTVFFTSAVAANRGDVRVSCKGSISTACDHTEKNLLLPPTGSDKAGTGRGGDFAAGSSTGSLSPPESPAGIAQLGDGGAWGSGGGCSGTIDEQAPTSRDSAVDNATVSLLPAASDVYETLAARRPASPLPMGSVLRDFDGDSTSAAMGGVDTHGDRLVPVASASSQSCLCSGESSSCLPRVSDPVEPFSTRSSASSLVPPSNSTAPALTNSLRPMQSASPAHHATNGGYNCVRDDSLSVCCSGRSRSQQQGRGSAAGGCGASVPSSSDASADCTTARAVGASMNTSPSLIRPSSQTSPQTSLLSSLNQKSLTCMPNWPLLQMIQSKMRPAAKQHVGGAH